MKKVLCILSVYIIALASSSCYSLTDQQLDMRKTGIIDACYIVLQYNPCDKKQRIQKYLNKKIEQKTLQQKQKVIIIKCLNRTQNSNCWKNKGSK